MNNRWDSMELKPDAGELECLAHAVRLLSQEAGNILKPGGCASLKTFERNWFDEDEEILHIDQVEPSPEALVVDDFTPLRCKPLARLVQAAAMEDDRLRNEIACCRTSAASPIPPLESLLHAVLPYPVILFSQPVAILAVASAQDGMTLLRDIFGETVLVLPYAPMGWIIARACHVALQKVDPAKVQAIYIEQQGLLTVGETARTAYQQLVTLEDIADRLLHLRGACYLARHAAKTERKTIGRELAGLRKAVSDRTGFPLIMYQSPDPEMTGFCQQEDITLLQQGPAVARDASLLRHLPMTGRDIKAFRADCPPDCPDPSPRVILDAEFGLCSLGRTAAEALLAHNRFLQLKDIMLRSSALGGYSAMPAPETIRIMASGRKEEDVCPAAFSTMFRGEIALVTGGASGIGKACVESLLARGAAVVSMDINPAVKTLYRRPDYLGLQVDLTDEDAVKRGFESVACTFGGLDMLVLNAGIFPAGVRIESLTLAEWQRVMRINLDPNLVVLREAHPLLKQSPAGGRVLVNASKNVLAPGAGAAAYSSSKAAVTQLARVAALEWGKDRIRVNMVHPDAIFDTGIWTEEVLKARAAHYGLTVQQYKTRNVLGVELNSHFVGELVAEMLGPRFEKITGAQIPVDGGSDRVI